MISMIAALSENGIIGKDGEMPWHLPGDLKFFKQTTKGHSVVMGRKTFESIGRPLPKRRNIVLTRSKDFTASGIEVIHSFSEMEKLVKDEEEIFVIGGATIYEQLLPLAERIYITKIHETFEGDTYFPDIPEEEWQIIESKEGVMDDKNHHPHTFLTYERKNNFCDGLLRPSLFLRMAERCPWKASSCIEFTEYHILYKATILFYGCYF